MNQWKQSAENEINNNLIIAESSMKKNQAMLKYEKYKYNDNHG